MAKTQTIYRLVQVKADMEAEFIGNRFYSSKELIKKAVRRQTDQYVDSGWETSDYDLHQWTDIHVDGSCHPARLTVQLTYSTKYGEHEYTYKRFLGYVEYEMVIA